MSLKINNRLLLILAVLCIFILIPSSFAADLDGNQTTDVLAVDDSAQDSIVTADDNVIYVSPTATEGDGSQDNPYNLTKAVATYDSSVNSKIIMKNGEYKFTEQLAINKDMTIEGESYSNVILNGSNQSSILRVSSCNIALSNLKFVNGYSEHTFLDNVAGGLQIGYNSQVLIDNCIFERNANGAITATGSYCKINIQNSLFESNYIEYDYAARGGALYVGGADIECNITNTTFENNYVDAPSSDGGAIYGAMNFESIVIDHCTFINNTADDGSAISSYCGGNISVFNTRFINQTASVIYDNQVNQRYLNLFIRNVTFDNESDENIVVEGKVNLVNLDNNTRLSGNNIDMYQGDDENYTLTLTDNNAAPIPDKEIIMTLTNYYGKVITFNASTNANGQVSFSMRNQTPGRYRVSAAFAGDSFYDPVETTNTIYVRASEFLNLVMVPDSIKIKEGDSYVVTGVIVDEFYEPDNALDASTVVVEWYNPTKRVLSPATWVDGDTFTFDIAQCSLKTNSTPYIVNFNVDPGVYEGYVSLIQANVTVDLSVDLPDVGDLDVIYVSTNGSDESGNGTQENPLASVQMALNLNKALGGGKTIVVDEGIYNISNFNLLADVTIVGNKSKTVFRQTSGRDGMFKIMEDVTINLINLTLIDGYTTPTPYSLITAYGEGVKVNIDGCEFRNNTCLYGGAIAVSHGASVYVDNSRFIDNRGILIQSAGGAINVIDGYLRVANTEFINNTACDGGAIYVLGGTADIINSTFTNNTAIKTTLEIGGGGAIYTQSTTNIVNSTFIDNYADLHGGAICISGGITDITKSYFENNTVGASSGEVKGSAIQSESYTTFTFNMEYSVLLSSESHNYLAFFVNPNEGSEINADYNYWGSNTWSYMNTNVDVTDYVIIQPKTATTPIYAGEITSIDVEFKNRHLYDGTVSSLAGHVHDYTVDVSSTLNSINSTIVTIVNNIAHDAYYADNVGLESILVKNVTYNFNVVNSVKKDPHANITISPGNTTSITVEVPADLTNNLTITVNDIIYSKAVGNGTITITLDTLPGDYEVVVSYGEDDVYRGFSKTEIFSIPKYSSFITVSVEDIVEDQSAYVNMTVTGGAEGNIVIILNGKYRYPAVVQNGTAFKEIYDLPADNYSVEVIYEGNKYYEESRNYTTFEVKQRIDDTPVEKKDGYAYINVETGSITTITVRVPANLTNNVTIAVNDDVYSKESGDGTIVLTVPTGPGDYSVNVIYIGDDNYNSFTGFTTFKIYDYCWFINETGYATLREAVDAAQDGDVIKGNVSVYEIDETVDIGHRYMPSEPWEIVKDVTITSMHDEPVTIKGISHRLFFVDSQSRLTLKNLILEGSDVGILDGGAVENMYDASVAIENCTISNFKGQRGGALFIWGEATVKDTIFENNYANGIGGAVFILSSVTQSNLVVIDNCTFTNNSAASYGGAVYLSGSTNNAAYISNSNFTDNVAHGKGGAVYVEYGSVVIDRVLFDSNKAIDYDFDAEVEIAGGAVYVSGYVYADISNTKFINNYAEELAGALACDNSLSGIEDLETGEIVWNTYYTDIDNCSFINNTADVAGGAMYLGLTSVATVNITDSIFDSNKAPEAAAISNDFGYLLVENTEFTNNVASNASLITTYGIYVDNEEYDAYTTIIDSRFSNNDVVIDIIQVNTYTVLSIENSVFDDNVTILINKGEANLTNVTQVKDIADYSLVNYAKFSLSENNFVNPIYNKGSITSETYVVVLDNETKSAAVGSVYKLKAVVCDDNGNIIELGNLTFIVGGKNITAVYDDLEFTADYDVAAGSQLVDANYTDAGLTKLVVKTAVIIGKSSTVMIVDVRNITVGENAIITVNVPPQAGGNVTVKVGNETYETAVKNGEAKFVIPDLTAGTYPVEITYLGDDSHAPNTQFANMAVNKVSDFIFDVKGENITTDSAEIVITLPEDFNGNVSVKVDGKTYSVPGTDGKVTLPLSDLTIGSHDVEVVFDGNDKYANNTIKTTLTLSKLESFVKVDVDDVIVGNDAVISLTVPDDATGDIVVTVDGKDYLVSVKNGKSAAIIPDLTIGSHAVEVTYIGDEKYLNSSNSTSFKVISSAKATLIELDVDGNKITGILKDMDGNPVSGVSLSYTIADGNSGNVTTGNAGEFTVQAVEGKKTTFKFDGNDVALASMAVITVRNTVVDNERIDTYIEVDKKFTRVTTDYYAGERGAFFYAVLKDANGNPLANKTVQIAVNGPIYNVTTDSQGRAGLQVNLAAANTYTYALSFKGDEKYNGSPIASSKLTVTKKSTSITAANKAFKAKAKTKAISITLKTVKNPYDGKTYLKAGKKVTLKINGKTYTAKTNAKGVAKFTIKLTKKGKYAALIKFAGDKTYKASSKKIKVTIK